ncbi:hypothetical protein [Burkholderia gladioli]|uniref:hypothetical protein n=1 Tax=Burkholderia gladioli TaxID=28095 RepID=UPI001640A7CE|nr:hypothetical protein [Burkholderia gladioli]
MHQGYLNLSNFRNARDYQLHTHRERGAALASAHGLSPSGPGAWERRTEDWYGIHLVAYIPRDAEAGLFGISRRFDGVYASVACRTVDEASAALSAVTREEFEQSVQRGLQLRAQDLGSCALDIEGDAFGLEDDVQREPIQRAAQAVQLPLL